MGLTGKKKAKVAYCLMDTPEEFIEVEARKRSFANGDDGIVDVDLYNAVKTEMTYSNLSNNLRVKIFDISFDEEVFMQIIDRVKLCRKFIETNYKTFLNQSKNVKLHNRRNTSQKI